MAFTTSLIRNLIGTGSLLAFPGSMVGAYLCGLLYQKSGKLAAAYVGEVVGTGLLGGILCYPVAEFLMGKEAALFMYVMPFFMSTMCGTIIAAVLIGIMEKSRVFSYFNQLLAAK